MVIIICVYTIRSEVRKTTVPSDTFPYLLEYPCTGWANHCFLMDAKSIQNHLQQTPLDPLAAIGLFFTQQKQSLLSIKEGNDETIQLLYRVAKKNFFFETDINSEEHIADELRQIRNQTYAQFNKALQALENDIPDPNTRKRTTQYLKDGLTYLRTHKKKYRLDNSTQAEQNTAALVISQAEGDADDPVDSQPEQSIVSYDSTIQDVLPILREPNANWIYIEDYRNNHSENDMDWEKCYLEGKQKGLFKKYNSWKSVKSGYYRFLKKKI